MSYPTTIRSQYLSKSLASDLSFRATSIDPDFVLKKMILDPNDTAMMIWVKARKAQYVTRWHCGSYLSIHGVWGFMGIVLSRTVADRREGLENG